MKKVLILGNSIKETSLAKVLSKTCEVYVAPGNDFIKEFATIVDIRDNSVSELLEFVMENGIDMVIPVSENSLKSDITEVFTRHNLQVFAPMKNLVDLVYDKASIKKLLYKLHIPTPKFGIFEKQGMVNDYIKNLNGPFVLKTNEASSALIFTSPQSAKSTVDFLFAEKNQKIIIEDYIWGTPFSFYVITDGYKALPIGSSIVYKHYLEGDGGQLTSGMGACVPNYKLSVKDEEYLMNEVVYPIIDYMEHSSGAYMGILGISGILTDEGTIQILGLNSFMNDIDTNGVLQTLDADLYSLFEACVLGTFSDEVDYIKQNNQCFTSLVLYCKNKKSACNVITGIDTADESIDISFYPNIKKNKYLEYEAESGPVAVLTASASTISSALQKVYEEISDIKFEGAYYRRDICKPLISSFND